jgi:hypothetical protein
MPVVIEHRIGALSEYTTRVSDELGRTRTRNPTASIKVNWYRGHGQTDYRLTPSLFRHPTINRWQDLFKLEGKMLEEFRRQSFLHGPAVTDQFEDEFAALFLMQHYGVPTRLLDWTGNPFIALYFALTDAPRSAAGAYDHDAAVWVLDATSWNARALADLTWENRGPLLPDANELRAYYPMVPWNHDTVNPYDFPVAVLGTSNNARMFAQKGVFTVFGKSLEPIESLYAAVDPAFPDGCLVKFVIPAAAIEPMLEDLIAIGYTDSVTYPDLQGLALEIRRLNGFRK